MLKLFQDAIEKKESETFISHSIFSIKWVSADVTAYHQFYIPDLAANIFSRKIYLDSHAKTFYEKESLLLFRGEDSD